MSRQFGENDERLQSSTWQCTFVLTREECDHTLGRQQLLLLSAWLTPATGTTSGDARDVTTCTHGRRDIPNQTSKSANSFINHDHWMAFEEYDKPMSERWQDLALDAAQF
jgi:hypothetical protein